MVNLAERIERATQKSYKFELFPVGGLTDNEYEYTLFASPLIACESNNENYSGSYLAYLLNNIKFVFEYSPCDLTPLYEYFIVRKYKKRF